MILLGILPLLARIEYVVINDDTWNNTVKPVSATFCLIKSSKCCISFSGRENDIDTLSVQIDVVPGFLRIMPTSLNMDFFNFSLSTRPI